MLVELNSSIKPARCRHFGMSDIKLIKPQLQQLGNRGLLYIKDLMDSCLHARNETKFIFLALQVALHYLKESNKSAYVIFLLSCSQK